MPSKRRTPTVRQEVSALFRGLAGRRVSRDYINSQVDEILELTASRRFDHNGQVCRQDSSRHRALWAAQYLRHEIITKNLRYVQTVLGKRIADDSHKHQLLASVFEEYNLNAPLPTHPIQALPKRHQRFYHRMTLRHGDLESVPDWDEVKAFLKHLSELDIAWRGEIPKLDFGRMPYDTAQAKQYAMEDRFSDRYADYVEAYGTPLLDLGDGWVIASLEGENGLPNPQWHHNEAKYMNHCAGPTDEPGVYPLSLQHRKGDKCRPHVTFKYSNGTVLEAKGPSNQNALDWISPQKNHPDRQAMAYRIFTVYRSALVNGCDFEDSHQAEHDVTPYKLPPELANQLFAEKPELFTYSGLIEHGLKQDYLQQHTLAALSKRKLDPALQANPDVPELVMASGDNLMALGEQFEMPILEGWAEDLIAGKVERERVAPSHQEQVRLLQHLCSDPNVKSAMLLCLADHIEALPEADQHSPSGKTARLLLEQPKVLLAALAGNSYGTAPDLTGFTQGQDWLQILDEAHHRGREQGALVCLEKGIEETLAQFQKDTGCRLLRHGPDQAFQLTLPLDKFFKMATKLINNQDLSYFNIGWPHEMMYEGPQGAFYMVENALRKGTHAKDLKFADTSLDGPFVGYCSETASRTGSELMTQHLAEQSIDPERAKRFAQTLQKRHSAPCPDNHYN
ncbi:hypothetical protein [Ferrimonas marina]|uniref:Uncharacterized protein n=1 Tax=Ferrimonas marina TaxID=299255 RepID=A0A1M5TYI1_9GAMM|nr:hypothetical protein [Ferrimonas marina]SHH55443.1 hypothetical protein SAMN02745129_2318 [Ferrimonas marina]